MAGDGRWRWPTEHPARARALLYGALAALLLVALVLVSLRRAADRQDRLDHVRARLDGLDLVLARDPTGREVLQVLDSFSGEDLPADLRQRAERARAFAHTRRGEGAEAWSAFDRAEPLLSDPRDRAALVVERGLSLAWLGEAERALEVLAPEASPAEAALVLWRALARAEALRQLDRVPEGAAEVERALAGLPRPLPRAESVLLALTPWSPEEAARQATGALAALAAPEADFGIWERLLLLCPGSFEAAVEATRGLRALGAGEKARDAWERARSLDPGRASEIEARDRGLGPDSPIHRETLK